ncbi:MAG: DUF2807 domain-containing protein [Burkholderiaceae bacterium]
MRRRSLFILPLAALVAACGDELRGDGVPARVTRELPPFQSATISGYFDVTIVVGAAVSQVTVSGDSNLLPQVQTTVLDKTLRIDSLRSYVAFQRIGLRVETPSLASVHVMGATQVRVEGITGSQFQLSADGAAAVQLTGQVDQLELGLNGAGEIDALALAATAASAEIKGAGRILVAPREALAVKIAGAGEVEYTGEPQLVQAVTGSGRVLHIKQP